jgi:hypothetical protein
MNNWSFSQYYHGNSLYPTSTTKDASTTYALELGPNWMSKPDIYLLSYNARESKELSDRLENNRTDDEIQKRIDNIKNEYDYMSISKINGKSR